MNPQPEKKPKKKATTSPKSRRTTNAVTKANESAPKTTRPEASERREAEPQVSASEKMDRVLDAFPDRIDVRDWFYQPRLSPLPDQLVNIDRVPFILNQGAEGACTGFALAAVVNFLLAGRGIKRQASPRMLYEMARRYDEWPGEGYEGSSARGAMKGWIGHGVCPEESWPMEKQGVENFTPEIAKESQGTPGGAYFRVSHREIRDMHAALNEVGILYATLMVHRGWDNPGSKTVVLSYGDGTNLQQVELPIIERLGRADGGHAIAIVGYTRDGFIIQNSWSDNWGAKGFALLPYEDYLLHATDVWVVQLGVPIAVNLWENQGADTTQGMQRAAAAIPLSEIRPYVMDVGNNGELSRSGRYWTTKDDLRRLFEEEIPQRTKDWKKKRVMLYLHGGLNDEDAVARRIVTFRDVLLKNEIYPLHIMWESGHWEVLNQMLADIFTHVDERAGSVADWFAKVREGLTEAKDLSLELTVSAAGTALWREMKENARLSSVHPDNKGGMQILAEQARQAMQGLSESEKKQWELHVVGHSAGCIYSAYAMRHLTTLGINFKTLQLMAPAMRVDEFKDELLRYIQSGACPQPTLYILSDVGERDDTTGPYGKSLLYLVSNAFEGARGTPLLGMERFIRAGQPEADPELVELFQKSVNGVPSLVVAGAGDASQLRSISRSNSHGGFDDDEWTLNSILHRILDSEEKLERSFHMRDLQY